MSIKCKCYPACEYTQVTSYGTEHIKCNNEKCEIRVSEAGIKDLGFIEDAGSLVEQDRNSKK